MNHLNLCKLSALSYAVRGAFVSSRKMPVQLAVAMAALGIAAALPAAEIHTNVVHYATNLLPTQTTVPEPTSGAGTTSLPNGALSELLPNTSWTLESSIADQLPSANGMPDCTDPTKCASYDGSDTAMLKEIGSPTSGGSKYDASLSPFYDNSNVGKHTDKTLIVSSLKDVQGFIYAYSNTNGYVNGSSMPSALACNNTLILDLNNRDGAAHEIRGVTGFNISQVPSVAAAAIARGGATDNQLLMRNSSIVVKEMTGVAGDNRPGWHMAAASVYDAEENSSGNLTLLDNVKISMDPNKAETDRHFVKIGALYLGLLNKDVSAKHNSLWISESEIEAGSLYSVNRYGGAASYTAENNCVFINNSKLWFNPVSTNSRNSDTGIYAVRNAETANNNWVEITNNEITVAKGEESTTSLHFAGAIGAVSAKANTLIVRDSNITSQHNMTFVGGYANSGSAVGNTSQGNSVFIGGTTQKMTITGDVSSTVYGGSAYASSADQEVSSFNNSVAVTNLQANTMNIYGGRVWTNDTGIDRNMRVENNDVLLSDLELNVLLAIGGRATGGAVQSNDLYLTNVTVTGAANKLSVLAGGRSDESGQANGNQIFIEDSKLSGDVAIYGGYVGKADAASAATNNRVVIGSNVTATDASILKLKDVYGGYIEGTGVLTGNSLMTANRFETENLDGFQHYEFIVSQDQLDQGAFISVTGANQVTLDMSEQNGSTIGIGLSDGQTLAQGSYTLIDTASGFKDELGNSILAGTNLDSLKTTLTTTSTPSIIRIEYTTYDSEDYDLSIGGTDGNDLILNIKGAGDTATGINSETDALMESSLSTMTTHFAAGDLFVDAVLRSRDGKRDGLFTAARGGKWSFDTRTRIENNIVSGLLGYGAKLSNDLTMGAFIEMGHGSYDTRTHISGSTKAGGGSHNYGGLGLFGDYAMPSIEGLHFTGYLKVGLLRNEFNSNIAGASVDYDRTGAYWGAHLGTHYDWDLTQSIRSRVFLSYFYDGQGDESFDIAGEGDVGGAHVSYDAIHAHRVQLGSMFEFAVSDTWRPYLGLTFEQILAAEAKGTATDAQGTMDLNSSDLEGSTGILSAGWTYQDGNFSTELGLSGYAGTRNGVSGQIQANWKF